MKALFKTLFIGSFILYTSRAMAELDGETITYFLTDHLGSPVVAMDEEGELLWKREYSAFGEAQDQESSVQVGHTGHEFVPESGLSYMGARWYHPKIGRFLQPDPVGFVSNNSLSFNRYLYVNNNPFQYVDPDGRYLTPANDMANKLASAIPSTSASTGLQDITISASNSVNLGTAGSPGGFAPIMSAQEYAANSTASASAVVGGWIAADAVVPEPTDVLPHKWLGYGAAIGAAATFDWTVGKIIQFAKSRPGSKPRGAPSGTLPIDKYGLGRQDIHDIKDGIGAGPRDWTGITPDGEVISGDSDGDAVNHGPYTDYTN